MDVEGVKGKVNGKGSCLCVPLGLETISVCAAEHVFCSGGKQCVAEEKVPCAVRKMICATGFPLLISADFGYILLLLLKKLQYS